MSASQDKTIKLWDLEAGVLLETVGAPDPDITRIVVTPDGRCAVLAGDTSLWLWEFDGPVRPLGDHGGRIHAVAVTADGRVVSGSDARTLKVWDLRRGTLLHTLQGHDEKVTSVAVTPDGRRAVSASYDATLKVWDLERGKHLRTLEGHTDFVRGVAVTPDGVQAVSAADDTTLKVWHLETGTLLRTLQGHDDWVAGVDIIQNGRRAVSHGADGQLIVWDLVAGRAAATFTADARLSSCAVSADGATIVADDELDRIHILRLENA